MITITRNSLNKVCLSLTENITISNPFFVFTFQPLSTLDDLATLHYFTAPDITLFCNRYNLFNLTEADGADYNADNLPIYLLPGQYVYNVYQSTTGSLDPNTFGILLETGQMVVGDLTLPNPSTFLDSVYQ